MQFVTRASRLAGAVDVPGSKSHTIRAVVLGMLADGESCIRDPLSSADTLSAVASAEGLGAVIERTGSAWRVRGRAGCPAVCRDPIDVGNSGTTLSLLTGAAALLPAGVEVTFTGDRQIQSRPNDPLVAALNDLGARAVSLRGNGCAPLTVGGHLKGGHTVLHAKSSQYLSSLLLACPLAAGDSVIDVPLLFEKPYVQMTLDWLARLGIAVEHEGMALFRIPGGQSYPRFDCRIPADFSSATFFFGAGALGENDVICRGLDMADSQADKAVVGYMREMGAQVTVDDAAIRVRAGQLEGIEIDMNETPDALPVMAVLGCFARGRTVLRNVAQARIKETDRIAVMTSELRKMGAQIEELEDGLIVSESALHGAHVGGHDDHRVVMALALAGLNCRGETVVTTAEAARVTFPTFADLMRSIGADIRAEE